MSAAADPIAPTLAPNAPLFVVLNARSGHGSADATVAVIQGVLQSAGRQLVLSRVDDPTRLAATTQQAAQQAKAAGGMLVAAGGDGTINTVASAAYEAGLPLGVLPQGTFNYFCRSHGIPADTADAARGLLEWQPQAAQLGLVNERAFLVNASLGLYPRLLEDREAFKNEYGRSRLVALWAALVTIVHFKRPMRLTLRSAGQERSVRTPTLFVGNNPLQLQQTGIAGSALERGKLVAVALRPVGNLALLGLLVRAAAGRLGTARAVDSFSFQSLTAMPMQRKRRVKVATDGEVCWLEPPLVFSVAPKPLWLMKPPESANSDAPAADL